MKPSEEIRKIWEEMKKLKRLREGKFSIEEYENEDRDKLENKFEENEILFGHEVNLQKATIYWLDEQHKEEVNK